MNEAIHEVVSFESVAEIDALVAAWESTTLSRAEWNHRAHLTVAIWHALRYPRSEALRLVRAGIQAYNRALGIEATPRGGYHETLTRFWMEIAFRFVDAFGRYDDEVEITNRFVEQYVARKGMALRYYREETLWSVRARASWAPPDLREL